MNKLTLGLLLLAFTISLNLTFAQDKIDSKDSKTIQKTEVTKPDVTKSEVTKPNVTKTEVTQAVVTAPGTGKPINAVCIVSGEELDSKVTADYKGKTYGFCCKTCLKKFTKDPEKYVTKYESKKDTKSKSKT
jgi:YHS domain-containing protein